MLSVTSHRYYHAEFSFIQWFDAIIKISGLTAELC